MQTKTFFLYNLASELDNRGEKGGRGIVFAEFSQYGRSQTLFNSIFTEKRIKLFSSFFLFEKGQVDGEIAI